ncbi:hypothetical protein EWM64_g652 [Hericium alpestre]|uniref:Uncharacterized protein n=1 Tax=Hericium alpestre TaxID=135208 RepID=A0A4Z0AAK1_9AGAM|nr:hypothetical protein EWM64_g652 [Hericium alpestre]
MPTLPQIFFADLVCEAVVYGIYMILFFAAMNLMIRSKRKRTWINFALMTLLIIMFGSSTAYFGLSIASIAEPFLHPAAAEERQFFLGLNSSISIVQLVLEGLNCVLGDSIVIWRAWVISNRKWWVLAIPACLLSGSGFCAFALAYEASLFSSESTGTTTGGFAKFSYAFGALTVTTNAFVTAVIAYHTWSAAASLKRHHRFIKNVLGIYTNPYRKLLVLLIESGALYCATWVSTFSCLPGIVSGTHPLTEANQLTLIVLLATQSPGIYILNDVTAQLTGIYPTLIIVLVCLELTHPSTGKSSSQLRSSQLPTHTSHSLQFRPQPSMTAGTVELELQATSDSTKSSGCLESEGLESEG